MKKLPALPLLIFVNCVYLVIIIATYITIFVEDNENTTLIFCFTTFIELPIWVYVNILFIKTLKL